MKNIIKSCSVFLLPLFFSCQQEDFKLENGGTIDIVIQDGVSGKTRSLPEPVSEEMAQQFSLRIRNEEKNWYKGTIQDYATSNTLFAPGSYEVSAWYGEDDELALDNPYYASEPLTVQVEANKETQATVQCYVANAMASFVFAKPESATTLLKNYEIVTEVGSQTVSCTVDDGQNPYFKAGTAVTFYPQRSSLRTNMFYSASASSHPQNSRLIQHLQADDKQKDYNAVSVVALFRNDSAHYRFPCLL